MQSLDDLFHALLEDLYAAENEQLPMLAALASKAADETLKRAFRDHEDDTREHVARLEDVFEIVGREPRARGSGAMTAIVAEAMRMVAETTDPAVRDAGMVAACQAAEHYEIARYGTLTAWAEQLGEDEVVDLLCESLEEERHAGEFLASIVEDGIDAGARPAAVQA